MISLNRKQLIGRVCKLVDLVSKSELNGRFVSVVGFDSKTLRFAVHLLKDPNGTAPSSISLSVKRVNLELFTRSFDDEYPDAPVAPASDLEITPTGSILDLSAVDQLSFLELEWIEFQGPCSLRGTAVKRGEKTNPIARITGVVCFHMKESGLIEVEDITLQGGIECRGGSTVIFRRCVILLKDCAANVGGEGTNVTFESCTFSGGTGTALTAHQNAYLTLINCTIDTSQVGLIVCENSTAHMIHCTVREILQNGLSVQENSLTMQHCTIEQCGEDAAKIYTRGTITLDNCRVSDCSVGVLVEGGTGRSTAVITNTVVERCHIGVVVQLGKTDVTVDNCKLTNNDVGMYVRPDSVGEIIINSTFFALNIQHDIYNNGYTHSSVTRDGVVLPQVPFTEEVVKKIEQIYAKQRKERHLC